jgi:hypothetical protein
MMMKIFISSLIGGYGHFREAVRSATETLGHQVVTAEDFAAVAGTPQQACLAGVREADVVVLLLGESYGAVQPSGLSATHEEYREARECRPVLVFVEQATSRDPNQLEFVDEVQAWATGHFRASYKDPAGLSREVIRALHEHELAQSVGPVEEQELLDRASALLPQRHGIGGTAQLVLVVAGGPLQAVLRPAELEDPALVRDVQREALFGSHPVLNSAEGTSIRVQVDKLLFEQQSASVLLDQVGSIRVSQAARSGDDRFLSAIPALIEEEVTEALSRGLRFAGWLLDRVDPLRRITDVVPVAALAGAGYMAWRTRTEHAASPQSGQIGQERDAVVNLRPARRRRQALTHDADRIAEDFVALLRRDRRR